MAKTKAKKWEIMKVNTFLPIQFRFGSFYVVDNDAAVVYFMQVMDNWMTATLLFDI